MPRPALSEVTNLPTPPSPPSSLTSYFPRKSRLSATSSRQANDENTSPLPSATLKRGVKRSREPRSSDVEFDCPLGLGSSPQTSPVKPLGSPLKCVTSGEDVDMQADEMGGEVGLEKPVVRRRIERRSLPGWPGMLGDRRLGGRLLPQNVPTYPHLHSLRSCNHTDLLRFPSPLPQRENSIPFSLAFSRSASRGGDKLLAVGTEEGRVQLVRAERRGRWDPLPQFTTLTPHENAIFALAFSEDDKLLATASGDRTCVITDIHSQQSVATLEGHTGSIRRVVWNPSNPQTLATAARDGTFRLWDPRLPEGERCTLEVRDAHAPTTPRRPRAKKGGMKQSVTGLVYAPGSEHGVITSGTYDGILKLWDCRSPKTPVECSPDPTLALSGSGTSRGPRRPRGIISLTLGGSSSDLLFALTADSRIRAYNALNLSSPVDRGVEEELRHDQFRAGTFYVGMECSPSGRYLAAGSSSGSAFAWDSLSGLGRQPHTRSSGVELAGHTQDKEVACVAWADDDLLATGGDDGMVRLWRAGPEEEMEEWWGVRAA